MTKASVINGLTQGKGTSLSLWKSIIAIVRKLQAAVLPAAFLLGGVDHLNAASLLIRVWRKLVRQKFPQVKQIDLN